MTCGSSNRATVLLDSKQADNVLNCFGFLLRFALLIVNKQVKEHNETITIDRVHWFRTLL